LRGKAKLNIIKKAVALVLTAAFLFAQINWLVRINRQSVNAFDQIEYTEPSVTKVSVTSPSVTKVSVTSPSVTKVSETKPSVTKVSATSPSVTKVSETKPSVTKVSATSPSVTKVSETKPSVTKVSATSPSVTKVSETKPSVTKVSATSPSVTKVSETKPSGTKPAETKPGNNETEEPKNIYEEIPIESFRLSNLFPGFEGEICDYIEWWYSEWEDCRYIFLPSVADRNSFIVSYSAAEGTELYLDDQKIVSGSKFIIPEDKEEYTIKAGKKEYGKLKIMQSDIGCVFLTTASGGLNKLDSDRYKTAVDTGSAVFTDNQGNIQYSGELEKITSHGNSSWDYSAKKPYNIKLASKADLYGMGKAKRWVLLSNYLDHSMQRNRVTFEMARAAGIEPVADYEYVDLFCEGSYRGTYQICEKVEVQKNRVSIKDLEDEMKEINEKEPEDYERKSAGTEDKMKFKYVPDSYKYYDIPNDPKDITGGYLLQFQLWNRYERKTKSGFVTSRGQPVQIDGPEHASKAQVEYIRKFIQELEDAIYSETGFNSKGRHYSEYMDVDSFIRLYLINEFNLNPDSTGTSFYMWKDSDLRGDGKLHFGPAWDYDLAYDNFPTRATNADGKTGKTYVTDNLYAAYYPMTGYDAKKIENGDFYSCGISWAGQLYKQEGYLRRVAKVYKECFSEYIEKISDENNCLIKSFADDIISSAEMNNARWHMYGGIEFCIFKRPSGENFYECNDYLRKFASKRHKWLMELWSPLLPDEKYTLVCDVNNDGKTDEEDIDQLRRYISGEGEIAAPENADLSGDGKIDILDICILKQKVLEGGLKIKQ